ncbi:hypothetical protein ES703_81503 [subsurface metagenome]
MRTAGVDEIGVKAHLVGEIEGKIVNKKHVVVGINAGKLYPLAAENLVVREINPKV